MKENPLVSVIIPVYNAANTLERCLVSIENQTYNQIEVIIVESKKSDDKTVEIAIKHNCKVLKLKNKERSPAINKGVKFSKGKYVYRVDSDVILDSDLIEEAVKKCEIEFNDVVSVFWSPDPTISFWAKVRKLEKDCYKEYLEYSGVRFFRKDVFNAIGGFNEELIAGEDYDLLYKILNADYKVAFLKSQELHIGEPKSIFDVVKKQYYYSKTIGAFFNENKTKGLIQVSPLRLPLIKNWKKFVKNPILTMGFIIYEFFIYSSSIIGYISAKLEKKA